MVSATDSANGITFVLSPNQPPPWSEIKIFFAGIALTSLTVCLAFAWLSFWPILPFAGLELTGLAIALYVTARRADYREVIRVDDNKIEYERGYRRPEQRWEFHRAWAEVALLRSQSPLRMSRLILRAHGREVEVGPFLIEQERCQLACALKRTIAR
jgi:uncharacterized membrane protein